MADFVNGVTLSCALSGATVQWTTAAAAQQTLTPSMVAEQSDITQGDPTTSDLLQQAMNEVSFDAGGGGGVSFMEHGGGEIVYVQEDGKLVSLNAMIASGNMAVMSVPETSGVAVHSDQHGAVTMDIGRVVYKGDNADTMYELIPSDPAAINNVTSSATYDNSAESTYSANDMATSPAVCPIQITDVRSLSSSQTSAEGQSSVASALSDTVTSDSAPLGSSSNPIRIIQRGNQYTAMQHLTTDQLNQILQVIKEQQQQQNKNPSSDGSAILYNPDADSQVMYRITTSSDLTGRDSGSGTVVQMVSGAVHSHQKKIIRERKKDDEDRMLWSELSRQEKELRKKHRPRTRSGRVSKPPQYMVKDYKHIHPVDYDEDYDDSDGGYSDFQNSGDEMDREDRHSKDDSMLNVDRPGRSTVATTTLSNQPIFISVIPG